MEESGRRAGIGAANEEEPHQETFQMTPNVIKNVRGDTEYYEH